jgi:hypothetical protein
MKHLPLALAFVALPTLAAPQLTSEIKEGDVWFKAGFNQSDSELELINPNGGSNMVIDSSSDTFGFSSLAAIKTDSDFTPLVGISFQTEEGDEEKAKMFGASLGFLKKSASQKNIGMVVNYNHRDNADESRGSFDISAAFQTSDILSKNYNELALIFGIPKDEGGIEGGRSLTVVNNLKISANDMVDFIASASLGLTGDMTLVENDITVDYDPSFGLSGELAVNLAPQFTLNFGLAKIFGGATYRDRFGDELDADIEATFVSANLIGRF